MSEPPRIEVHQDFAQVYDRDDPRPYYRALAPLDYRMPGVIARFLRANHHILCDAFDTATPRLVDFACGFGAVPALLRHDIDLAALYALYDADLDDGGDAGFFERHRRADTPFEIGGVDIAARALAYAHACGLIDHAFDDDTLAAPPGPALARFLDGTAVIFESGSTLNVLMPALLSLIDTASTVQKPWLLYAPRFDVDDAPLRKGLAARGYVVASVNSRPIRYRRSISAKERRAHVDVIRGLGRDPEHGFDGDYLVLDLNLARPEPAAEALAVGKLAFND
jgi:hypothetical protein